MLLLLLLPLRLFLLSVGCCLPGSRSERASEQLRGRQRMRVARAAFHVVAIAADAP